MAHRHHLATGLLMLALAAGSAHAATPSRVWPAAPQSQASPIWSDPAPAGSAQAADLAARGYVREEKFLAGKANVWKAGTDGKPQIAQADIPYVTRLVVIRPTSAAKFSGQVHLVPIHPSSSATPWEWVSRHVLDNGDAFVAVMIGGDVPSRAASTPERPASAPLVLKPFNPARYDIIDWPEEDGVRWDVFAQTAASLKADTDGVLGGLKVRRIYASGWSFTGSFLRTFINEGFHDRARSRAGAPLIDGYLIGISAGGYIAGYVPLNNASPVRAVGDPMRTTRSIDVPIIELMSENEALTNTGAQPPENDTPREGHRLYELGGLTHGDGLRSDQDSRRAPGTCPHPTSDVPMSHFARAALANLDRWVSGGPPPPKAARIQRGPDGRFSHDEVGNVMGGVRPVQLDVPLAAYAEPQDQTACPRPGGPAGSYVAIKRMPLDAATLKRLYPGGLEDYLAKVDSRLSALTAERWLAQQDAKSEQAQARSDAQKVFP